MEKTAKDYKEILENSLTKRMWAIEQAVNSGEMYVGSTGECVRKPAAIVAEGILQYIEQGTSHPDKTMD